MDDTEIGTRLKIEFWGVRGSIPTAELNKVGVGGNTPCIALRYHNESPVIIDAGTGLRLLGAHLACGLVQPVRASIFFSHFHWDHIQGLPFFAPMYADDSELTLYSGISPALLKQTLTGQMAAPYFPIQYSATRARCLYSHLPSLGCQVGSLRISPIQLHHPGDCTGFRVDSPAGSLAYISDHEHGISRIDDAILEHTTGTDLLIYDAHFTPAEYPQFRNWGHSTWLEATRLANRAGCGQLALFHHSPFRTDEALYDILQQARHEFSNTVIATENRDLVLSKEPTFDFRSRRVLS